MKSQLNKWKKLKDLIKPYIPKWRAASRFKYLLFLLFINTCIFGNISIASEPNEYYRPKIVTQIPDDIKISSQNSEIEVGEPLIFEMTYFYPEHVIDPGTGSPAKAAEHSAK